MTNEFYKTFFFLFYCINLGIFSSLAGCSFPYSKDSQKTADAVMQGKEEGEQSEISFEKTSLERRYDEGSGNAKLSIIINYPKAKPKKDSSAPLANSINQMIETSLVELIKSYMPEESEAVALEPILSDVAGQLGASYEDAYAKAKIKPQWSINIDGEIVFSNLGLVTFALSDKVYLGGAHGQESYHLASYNLAEGKKLALSDLVTDIKSTTDIVEQDFRSIVQVDPKSTLRDAGYGCEDGNFCIPQNIGLTRKGLLLVYNPYDIAPYADGQIRVLVGYPKLRQLINAQTKLLLGSAFSSANSDVETNSASPQVGNGGSNDALESSSADSSQSILPQYLEPEKVIRGTRE